MSARSKPGAWLRAALLPIALAILLGLLTTCFIAWRFDGLGRTVHTNEFSVRAPTSSWGVRVWTGNGFRNACNLSSSIRPGAILTPADIPRELLDALPYAGWRSRVRLYAPDLQGGGFWNMQAVGWPFRCFTSGFVKTGGPRGQITFGRIERAKGDRWDYMIIYDPEWPGLLTNVAIFAAAWLPVVILPVAAHHWWRRRWRRRHGRCVACAYDLRSVRDRCPECGTSISPGAPRAAT